MTSRKRRTDVDLAARVKLLKTDPEHYHRANPRIRFGFQAKGTDDSPKRQSH